jgi:V/A-type H+-transporting ATPase subunit A
MREISGRLQEMPGEEGYPAYLGSRIASFYERSGRVVCQGGDAREGSLTVIGAVSPPGGDLSDPVVQATLRVVKVFWSLEDKLAYQRHFPAISWINSYSLYHKSLEGHLRDHAHPDAKHLRTAAARLLQEEAELAEIVKLVGPDALSAKERLTLLTARSIREDFLHQNAFHPIDTYSPPAKEFGLLAAILALHDSRLAALAEGTSIEALTGLPVEEAIATARYLPNDRLAEIAALPGRAARAVAEVVESGRGVAAGKERR